MTKHTKGSWKVVPRLSGSENHKGYRIYQPENGYWLAEVFPIEEDGKEGGANANLMAAAPDLLEVLESFVKSEYIKRQHPKRYSAAMKAIAKAKGQA